MVPPLRVYVVSVPGRGDDALADAFPWYSVGCGSAEYEVQAPTARQALRLAKAHDPRARVVLDLTAWKASEARGEAMERRQEEALALSERAWVPAF